MKRKSKRGMRGLCVGLFGANPILKCLVWATCGCALAIQPCSATRIEGRINVDGQPFDGWMTVAEVSDLSASLLINLRIVKGELSLDLNSVHDVARYEVHLIGTNRTWTQTWSVPQSASQLDPRNIIVSSGAVERSWSRATGTPESATANLVSDLNARPISGPGFGVSAVAVIDADGQIETAVGNLGACLMVDGTTKPCDVPSFVDAETPAGSTNGSNVVFLLANVPIGPSLALFRNGLYMTTGVDYTLAGQTITFTAGAVAVPQPGDILTASYRVDSNSLGRGLRGHSNRSTSALEQALCTSVGNMAKWPGYPGAQAFCAADAGTIRAGGKLRVTFTLSVDNAPTVIMAWIRVEDVTVWQGAVNQSASGKSQTVDVIIDDADALRALHVSLISALSDPAIDRHLIITSLRLGAISSGEGHLN